MRSTATRPLCALGLHRPRPNFSRDGGVQRSTCIDCDCALMRTDATRQWFLSGLLA